MFRFGDQKVNRLEDLAKLSFAQKSTPERLRDNIHDPVRHARFRELFRAYAGHSKSLHSVSVVYMMQSVAAELGVDPRHFGSPDSGMTWEEEVRKITPRFDFDGTGDLDEEECFQLILCLLENHIEKEIGKRVGQLNIPRKRRNAEYETIKKLGEGGQGAAYLVKNKNSQHDRVLKQYDKSDANAPLSMITAEFETLRKLDHPKVMRLYDIFQDSAYVYIVGEPYKGGDLTKLGDNMKKYNVTLTVGWLARIVFQMFQGVNYLHSKYIMHCDLKEPNVMISSVDAEEWRRGPNVVVIDFGLCQNFATNQGCGGTPGYIPPEVWKEQLWTPKGDIFTLGVIVYALYSGRQPFLGHNLDAIAYATCNFQPSMRQIQYSSSLVDIVQRMLQKDYHSRPNANECLNHMFSRKYGNPESTEKADDVDKAVDRLQNIGKQDDTVKAILTDIADRLNFSEMQEMNKAFMAVDADNDGVISADELKGALKEHNSSMTAADIDKLVAGLVDEDGIVSYTAFMGLMLGSKNGDEQQLLHREFDELDTDNSGFLDQAQVNQMLERPALKKIFKGRRASDLMELLDPDRKGKVFFDDFKRALVGGDANNSVCQNCPKGHRLQRQFGGEWYCDGIRLHGRCQSGLESNPSASKSMSRYRCQACDYDLCEACANLEFCPPARRGEGRRRTVQGGTSSKYQKGQEAEYHSTHYGWIPCEVVSVSEKGEVMLNCKMGYWMPLADQEKKLRPTKMESIAETDGGYPVAAVAYKAGQAVEYHSQTQNCWMACTVQAVSSDGVMVDCKPGYFIPPADVKRLIRKPAR